MKKIGLITIYHVPNYGSVLQTYATQCIIEKMGFECIILNYKYPNEWHYAISPERKPKIKNKIVKWLGLKPHHRKAKKLMAFKKQCFHLSRMYKNLDELKKENWKDYNAFVVGSDQVWNPRFTLGDSAFLLSFVPDDKIRISFASSFASSTLPAEYKLKYKTYLEKFDSLSVREENGKRLIEKDLGLRKEVRIVLDPTLLLAKNEWLEYFPQKKCYKEKYILLYVLTYAFEARPYVYQVAEYYQEKYGYDIIALEGYVSQLGGRRLKMVNKSDSSVEDFISLFANAEMVITTSFHGTAFALNFGIPLISIVPDSNRGDDRQYSLLSALNLSQCIVPISTSLESINPFYNVELEQKELSKLREASLSWFSTAMMKSKL